MAAAIAFYCIWSLGELVYGFAIRARAKVYVAPLAFDSYSAVVRSKHGL
jgi:hypothetical protein